MDLLAADQADGQQRAPCPDRKKPRLRRPGPPQGARCRPAPAPGPEEHRHQRQKEPDRAVMGKGCDHPPGALPPEDVAAIGRIAEDQRRNKPQRDQCKGDEDRQAERAGKGCTGHPGLRPAPQRQGDGHRQDVDQDHRPLRQNPERKPRTKAKYRRHARPPGQRPDCQQGCQRGHGQQRVEHRGRAVGQEHPGRGQHPGRPAGALGCLGPEFAGQPCGQQHRRRPCDRSDQTPAQFGDAGDRPDKVDDPEQQRRLVAVDFAVQMRHDFRAAVPHLPGDGQIARLVHWQQRAQQHKRQ